MNNFIRFYTPVGVNTICRYSTCFACTCVAKRCKTLFEVLHLWVECICIAWIIPAALLCKWHLPCECKPDSVKSSRPRSQLRPCKMHSYFKPNDSLFQDVNSTTLQWFPAKHPCYLDRDALKQQADATWPQCTSLQTCEHVIDRWAAHWQLLQLLNITWPQYPTAAHCFQIASIEAPIMLYKATSQPAPSTSLSCNDCCSLSSDFPRTRPAFHKLTCIDA